MGKVFDAASRWANRFGSSYLGTDHVALGLLEVEGAAGKVLTEAGLTIEELRDAIQRSMPKSKKKLLGPTNEEALDALGLDLEAIRHDLLEEYGTRLSVMPGLMHTTALTVATTLAEQQAERLGSGVVTPAHLLLALLWQGDPWVTRIGGPRQPPSELRGRLLECMDVPATVRSRYIRECERTEDIAAKRRAASGLFPNWITESAVEEQVADLLSNGGRAAVSSSPLLKRVLKLAARSEFSVIDGANPASSAFWIEANTRLRQLFVASAIPGSGGDEIRGVGVTNPGRVPSWVDVRSWPGFPRGRRRPRGPRPSLTASETPR